MVHYHKQAWRHAPAALLLAILGCGDSTAPMPEQAFERVKIETASAKRGARGHILRRTFMLRDDATVTTTVTPRGGWLTLPEAGLALYFSAGAVSSDIVVTATAHAGQRVVYTFEPHGTVFNAPVYVTQELRRTELNTGLNKRERVWAGYLSNGLADVMDDGSGAFAEVFDVALDGNATYAVFTTTHFSGYAMASGNRR